MDCFLLLGLVSCRLMNRLWCRSLELALSGLMVRASIVAIRTFVAVVSVMLLTLVKDAGWRCQAYDNPSLELNSWRLFGL
eukprot:4694198-Amphidinium_carterae.1